MDYCPVLGKEETSVRRLACALAVSLLVLSGCQPSATVDLTLEVSVASHVLTLSGSTEFSDRT